MLITRLIPRVCSAPRGYFVEGRSYAALIEAEASAAARSATELAAGWAQAAKMLMDIAAKTATQPAPGGEKMSPEDVVKKGKKTS